jgi:hypothetical protein
MCRWLLCCCVVQVRLQEEVTSCPRPILCWTNHSITPHHPTKQQWSVPRNQNGNEPCKTRFIHGRTKGGVGTSRFHADNTRFSAVILCSKQNKTRTSCPVQSPPGDRRQRPSTGYELPGFHCSVLSAASTKCIHLRPAR